METTLAMLAREANDYVTDWLLEQPTVREKSLTDWLLDFLQQSSSDVRYYEFNPSEEVRISGADWDWWFLLRNGCLKLRVKAKKMRRGVNYYSDFARSTETGCQIDLLLDSSAAHNFYPLYLLYSKAEGPARCRVLPDPTVLSICGAQEVYDLIHDTPRCRIRLKDILEIAIPLECLFSCPVAREFPEYGPKERLNHYFEAVPRGRAEGVDTFEEDLDRGYEECVPEIVGSLFEFLDTDNNTENLLRKYQSMFPGSRGVSVVRFGDKLE